MLLMYHARGPIGHHLLKILRATSPQARIRQPEVEIPCAVEKFYHDQAWSSTAVPPQYDVLNIEVPQTSCHEPFAEELQPTTDHHTNSITPQRKPLTCEDAWRFPAEIPTIYTPFATPQHGESNDIFPCDPAVVPVQHGETKDIFATRYTTLATPQHGEANDIATRYTQLVTSQHKETNDTAAYYTTLATSQHGEPNDVATRYTQLARLPHEWTLNDDGVISVDKRWRHEQHHRERRPLPKLVYLQNPLAWLANKLDFNVLRRLWDPDFDEWEFRRGAKQAISTVTHLLAADNFTDMKGLLTPSALTSLKGQPMMSWGDKKRLVALNPDDIQLALPRKLHFNTLIDQKFCDIDMMFVALKWVEDGTRETIIYLESIARFHREYTEGRVSDWTISLFKITKFKSFPGYGKLL